MSRNPRSFFIASGALVLGVAALGVTAVLATPATLMAPSDYYAARTSIEARANADLDDCAETGDARGACEAQVQAEARTRKALLKAQYLGTVKASLNARFEKVRGEFDIAVAECKLEESDARDDCLRIAREQKAQSLAEAKLASNS